ncbi:hypothetical protein PFLUV_G00228210 [Perca fluviatilis]|uniref:Uncharacterized protein n=1 Tax=Perca fluviatilis TaxID=8168 RepID=A0A6A5E5C8_PERFL|nr:hypothetical protein PFLUV_G00228210 [Perca fluviatilis]
MAFSLIKTKITSDKRRECDTYNLTSQAEDEDDEVIRLTRKRTKKGISEGFVVAELTDSDEECGIGVKLSTFPTAPRKLQPIENTNMLHNTSHEDGAMSGQVEHADSPWGSEMSTPTHEDGAMSGQVERADSPRGSEMSTYNSVSQPWDGLVEAFSGPEKCAARSRRKEMSNASTAPREQRPVDTQISS